MGAELCLAGPGDHPRSASRFRLRRRGVSTSGWRSSLDRASRPGLSISRCPIGAEPTSRSTLLARLSSATMCSSRRAIAQVVSLVEVLPDFTHRVVWTTQDFALHFNTPIYCDGYLYGFDGRNQGDASLACVDAMTGHVVWREAPTWTETFEQNGQHAGIGAGHRTRFTAGRRRTVCLSWRIWPPYLDGSNGRLATPRFREPGWSPHGNRGHYRCSAGVCSTSRRTRAT